MTTFYKPVSPRGGNIYFKFGTSHEIYGISSITGNNIVQLIVIFLIKKPKQLGTISGFSTPALVVSLILFL